MKIAVLAPALFSLLLAPCPSRAQGLKDLGQVQIITEVLGQPEKDLGLSDELLESQTLVALKRDLPNLKIDRTAPSALYVRVTAIADECGSAVFVSVQLKRPVKVLGDKSSEAGVTAAAVWERGVILSGPRYNMAPRVRQEISGKITDLAADYYRQNAR